MLKELKAIDKQLKNNQLVRIQDSTNKVDSSLFRALSMALLFSHAYSNDIKLELRLALLGNLSDRKNNPYPPLLQPHILKKYQNDQETLMTYWQRPQLQCFQNDNLALASSVFNVPICILTLDKDQYLNETYIIACRSSTDSRIYLAKVGKKYYCAFEQEKYNRIKFVKEYILEQFVSRAFCREEGQKDDEIVHYAVKQEGRPAKQHKKSLSDCNELIQQLNQRRLQLQQASERSLKHSNTLFHSSQLPYKVESPQQVIDNSNKSQNGYQIYDSYQMLAESYQNYYPYQYQPYLLHEQRYATDQYVGTEAGYQYMEVSGPVNNQRYTGRLKFFEQSGNYGFIVIDNLNIDLFVHYDDLSKAGLSKQKLMNLKNNYELRFEFTYYEYEGKQHKKSKKAVDLQLIPE